MKVLIKSALVLDSKSSFHKQRVDLFIEDGKIIEIAKSITKDADEVITSENLHLSPGWIDMKVSFNDPGNEHKEDIESGLNAAAQGGFTAVCTSPGTDPICESKSLVDYQIQKSKAHLVDLYPIGAATKSMKGESLCEMLDMKTSGAVAFSDDKNCITDTGIMALALEYAKNIDSLIISFPTDKHFLKHGLIHEGEVSVQNGLVGIPDIAETIILKRDIDLARYLKARIHFTGISSGDSIAIIEDAKKSLDVSCDVAAYSLLCDDTALTDFNSNYKVLPPIRDKSSREKLIEGIKKGVISVICSDHRPQEEEKKEVEFPYAEFGMIGCESFFGVVNTALKDEIDLETSISCFTSGPRKILGLKNPHIAESEEACISLFDPDLSWTFDSTHIRSKSKNSPFIGNNFTGKAIAVINSGKLIRTV